MYSNQKLATLLKTNTTSTQFHCSKNLLQHLQEMLCFSKAIKCTPNLLKFCILNLQFKLLNSIQQICFRFSLSFRTLKLVLVCSKYQASQLWLMKHKRLKTKVTKLTCAVTREKNMSCIFLIFFFFYLSSLNGWFCKVCTNFAPLGNQERPFIEIPSGFGDHPTDRSSLHLCSKRHQQSVLNKQAFNELRAKNMGV